MRRMRQSFSFKIMALFGLSVFIVLCMTSLVFIYNQSQELHDRMLKRGKLLSDLLATRLVASVFAENRTMVDHDVQSILKQNYILSVKVIAGDGTVLSNKTKDTADKEIGKVLASFSGNAGRKWSEGPFRMHEVSDAFIIRKPIILHTPADLEEALFYDEIERPKREDVIGFVDLVVDKRDLDREILALFLKGVPVAIVWIIVSAVLMYWIVRRSMRPLDNLAHAVDSFGQEGAAENIQVETEDEIGRLAASFNTMTGNLKQREKEKEDLEKRLRESQKMEAVGTFARGIAHDFNNILATVKGSVFIIEKKSGDNPDVKRQVEPIKNSLQKAKNLIEGLLTFSKRRGPDFRQVQLNIFIRVMGPAIKAAAGENVEVRIETSGNGLNVMADSLQMEQVLLNLAGNARDAMPDGGTLVIKTGVVKGPARPIGIKGSAEKENAGEGQAGYAEISVRDSGTGMDRETMTKIFEPFFTTKEVGKGTGLGLAIVYGIIDQHGGYIEVDSREGDGTEFRIYLPLIPDNRQQGNGLT